MRLKLGVNIDHVATLRQARGADFPSVADAAELALASGADFLVAHLRGDRRHMQESDIKALAAGGRLHLEMACTEEMEKIALKYKPCSVCIVPEKKGELTTGGGLDLKGKTALGVEKLSSRLMKKGIGVSLFLDAEPNALRTAHKMGIKTVELCTKTYAESKNRKAVSAELENLAVAAIMSRELDFELHAGHGLDYTNAVPVSQIDGFAAFNIGFAIIARSLYVGLPAAVKEMKELLS
ncbi:MAG: pyridoxine 5'-phosphate synthase [Elusimicrobiaceae bacterium]|jgi:pyridoxine 5-phosphate synthase